MKLIILASLMCHAVTTLCSESLDVNTGTPPDTTSSNITQLMFDEILERVKLSQNFLIAPEQIKCILETYGKYDTANPSLEQFMQQLQASDLDDPHFHVENTVLKQLPRELRKSHRKLNVSQLLQNSVSLQAGWKVNFHRRDSHKRMFHSKHHRNLYTEAMRKDDVFPYAELPAAKARAVQLALHQSNYKMLLILPDEPTGLPDVVRYFRDNPKQFHDILYVPFRESLVRVIVPKFHISNDVVVQQLFKELVKDEANSDDEMSLVIQTTSLKLSEEGIGDFENRIVLFWNLFSSARITPKTFEVSHPFLFFICDDQKVQIVGVVNEIS